MQVYFKSRSAREEIKKINRMRTANKVAAVTFFWLMKIVATTLGKHLVILFP
jgi:uncharacterized membrane-anchored protein